MPLVPEQLRQLTERVQKDGRQRETVRTLLSWFGAQRRGYWISKSIRDALKEMRLVTGPPFDAVYIDDFVEFSLEEPAPKAGEGGTTPGPEPDPDPIVSLDVEDLVPKVGMLTAANREPLAVSLDDKVEKAVTLMLLHDYSQLPVMSGNRTVKGFISWQTIGQARTRNETAPEHVRDCMSTAIEVLNWDETLFSATQRIIAKEFVLIRGRDQSFTGLVTTSDIGLQFKDLSEAFLLIGEIENHLRRLLSGKYRVSDLKQCVDPTDTKRKVESLSDLTFGEYIRLIENPDQWQKLGLALDRTTFVARLNVVRRVRNDVMHFHPDGISQDDVGILNDTLRFLQGLC